MNELKNNYIDFKQKRVGEVLADLTRKYEKMKKEKTSVHGERVHLEKVNTSEVHHEKTIDFEGKWNVVNAAGECLTEISFQVGEIEGEIIESMMAKGLTLEKALETVYTLVLNGHLATKEEENECFKAFGLR